MGKVIDVTLQLVDKMTGPLEKAGSKLAAHANQYVKAGRQIQNAGKSISAVGTKMTKTLTVPILAAGTAAVKAASDFETGMDKVQSIAGTVSNKTLKEVSKSAEQMGLSFEKGSNSTETAMNILSAQAKKMGATTKYSATEATEAYQYMAMAGWTAGDMLNGIEPIMKLAGATGESLGTTSDIVTDALTAFGMSSNDTQKFVDILAKTSSSANTNVAMLGESFKYVAPVAGSLGYSAADTSKMLGIMADSGIKASSAGTALRSTLSRLSAPSKDTKVAMEALGISMTDEHGKMKSLDTLMGEMRTSFSKLTETQKAQYASSIAGKNGMSGLLAVVNSSDAEWNKMTKAMKTANGAANEMYDTANDNLNGQLTILKSTVESIAISFGEKLTPYVKALTGHLQTLANKFNSLTDSQQRTIIKILGILAAIGPALLIFGKMVTGVGKVVSIVGKLGMAIKSAGGVMALITSPAGIVIAVLAGIALAAVLIIKNWDKVKPVVMKVKNAFMDAIGGSGGVLETFKKTFSTVLQTLSSAIKSILPVVKQLGMTLFEGIAGVIKKIFPFIKQFVSIYLKMVVEYIKLIGSVIKAFVPVVMSIVSQLLSALIPVIKTVMNTIKQLIPIIAGTLMKVIKAIVPVIQIAIKTVKQIIPIIANTLMRVFKALMPVIKTIMKLIQQLVPVIGKLLAKAFKMISPLISKAGKLLSRVAKIVGGTLIKMFQKASPVIEKLATLFSVVFSRAFKIVSSFVKKLKPVFNAIGTLISGALEVLEPIVTTVFNNIGNVISNAANFISSVFDSIMDIFGGLIDFITGVFTGNWSQAWNGIVSIFKGIFNLIPAAIEFIINGAIGIINGLISGINWATDFIGIPAIPEIPTVSIPRLAKGTENWRGGIVQISERGGEIVDLPQGSRVYPHDKSVSMAKEQGRKEGKNTKGETKITITIPKLADQIVVREDGDIDKVAQRLADKLEKVAKNMGGGEVEYSY